MHTIGYTQVPWRCQFNLFEQDSAKTHKEESVVIARAVLNN